MPKTNTDTACPTMGSPVAELRHTKMMVSTAWAIISKQPEGCRQDAAPGAHGLYNLSSSANRRAQRREFDGGYEVFLLHAGCIGYRVRCAGDSQRLISASTLSRPGPRNTRGSNMAVNSAASL